MGARLNLRRACRGSNLRANDDDRLVGVFNMLIESEPFTSFANRPCRTCRKGSYPHLCTTTRAA